MKPRVLLVRLLAGHRENVTFADFVRLVDAFGFVPDGSRGSHQFFKHSTRSLRLNLQPRGREAKRYQIDQFLATIEEYDVKWEKDDR